MVFRYLLNTHTKRYVDAVFAEKLRKEGFACPDDRHICWYRVMNDTVVNSIVFYSVWPNMPILLFAGYGIHPLFEKPVYTTNAFFSGRPVDPDRFKEQPLMKKDAMNRVFANDIQVMVPNDGKNGLHIFEDVILPKMENVTSVESCYQLHKNRHLDIKHNDLKIKFGNLSGVFVDEAIYVGDSEVYPYCLENAQRRIEMLKDAWRPSRRAACKLWERRKDALLGNTREDYLQELDRRMSENKAELKIMLER